VKHHQAQDETQQRGHPLPISTRVSIARHGLKEVGDVLFAVSKGWL
jgi:hypothetical protein